MRECEQNTGNCGQDRTDDRNELFSPAVSARALNSNGPFPTSFAHGGTSPQRIARTRGLTVLFTEHDMDVVFAIADRIMVLHQGRVIADGAAAAVRADPQVQRVYLGEDE